jgi:hypothetical protein
MAESAEFKVKEITKGSAFGAYRALMYGDMGLGRSSGRSSCSR